ncbi:MAG: dUTP diphosphatase [Synergistaceae bacterium]|nr:dUTP diphosphatase [Synergistaceae bacterium]
MFLDRIIIRVKSEDGVTLPAYATPGSSGMDLRSTESAVIKAGEWGCVGTGLYLEMPQGCEAQIRPRSGLALKHGVTVLNAPGTIDSDYRGEVRIILINHGKEDFKVEPGDRIAQMIFAVVTFAELVKSEDINDTKRSDGGFGSTGVN